tara:strand:- start:1476 stop:1658 length:183 start_codon:yes stop_codon:yes gene_type:complete
VAGNQKLFGVKTNTQLFVTTLAQVLNAPLASVRKNYFVLIYLFLTAYLYTRRQMGRRIKR